MPKIDPGFNFMAQWAWNSCGVTIVGDFKIFPGDEHYAVAKERRELYLSKAEGEGTGYVMAAYVDTPQCKEAERYFGARWKEVFRSETRLNKNSGRHFYFVVYDVREKPNGNS